MPELPEVETVRRSLVPVVKGQSIVRCLILYDRVLPLNEKTVFCADLVGRVICDLRRRGKYLVFVLDNAQYLVIHLRMTGQLLVYGNDAPAPHNHTSVILSLDSGQQLHFHDQRRFGTFYLVSEEDMDSIEGLRTLGPEPLSDFFTIDYLQKAVQGRSPIKSILLNQKRIAGLGNIYADEVLFQAGIAPTVLGSHVKRAALERLHRTVQIVLREAVELGGSTIRDYVDGHHTRGAFQDRLQVYGQTGKPCPRCGTRIERLKIGGRSSHFCPHCQKEDGQ